MNLYTNIQQTVQEKCATIISCSKQKYVKESLLATSAMILLVGGYVAFGWYQQRKDMQAFAGLVEISKSYESALAKVRELESKPAQDENENPWEDTQLLLEAIASANSGSTLSPFFVMYQAQLALQAEKDYDKACMLMEQGVRRLAKNSPYYDMFNLKRIKMLLDSPMQDVRDKAAQDLDYMAHQKDNYYAQEALWVLGCYQAFYDNMSQAIENWKLLAQTEQSDKTLIKSPWVSLAQEKLKTLQVSLPENK